MNELVTKPKEFIWCQKYRPNKIDDVILPERIKEQFRGMIKEKQVNHLLLSGSAGCGKTTLALAMCEEIGADVMFLNASLEANMDMIRSNIIQFASSVSFTGSPKVVVFDEGDAINSQAQDSLRGILEQNSANCRFIITCNYPQKIKEPIRSRCNHIEFKISGDEKRTLQLQFIKRVRQILDAEGVTYDVPALAELCVKKFPDFRSILNILQGYSSGGKIDAGILLNLTDESFNVLLTALKAKKFSDVRKWCAENSDLDTQLLFRQFYDKASEVLEPKSLPELIMVLGDWQYKMAFSADKEIAIMSMLTSILIADGIKFK